MQPPPGHAPPGLRLGGYFVRDDETFYYTKNRTLYRKSLTASAFAAGEPITVRGRFLPVPVIADGVLFATDTELWSYVFDIPGNTLTVFRTRKKGFSSKFEDVLTLPGLSMKKFALVDVVGTDGNPLTSELVLLTMDGRLYRSPLWGLPSWSVRESVISRSAMNAARSASGRSWIFSDTERRCISPSAISSLFKTRASSSDWT